MAHTPLIEVERVNFVKAEQLFARSIEIAKEPQHHMHMAEAGILAARLQDPRLLKALEQLLGSLTREYEHQLGETQRRSDMSFANKVPPHVIKAYQNAYELADHPKLRKWKPADPALHEWAQDAVAHAWLYAAVAEFVGAIG
jgi:hypothetical protein